MPERTPPPLPPPPSPAASKAAWRAWARAARRILATSERSRLVSDGIRAWPGWAGADGILLYLAFGSEADLHALVSEGEERIVVPRTGDDPHGELSLHRLEGADLERHPFGPLQPRKGAPSVDPAAVQLALVPGLCFDRSGTRLGYGGGHFDRFLGRLAPTVPRLGVTFESLVVDALPREPHDVPVTHLATEAGVRPVDPTAP